jgi:hypothetical protein
MMGMTWEKGGNSEVDDASHQPDASKEPLMYPITSIDPATSIDMVTPAQVCTLLCLDERDLLDMVNQGQLAAYNIGGEIRFKTIDVVKTIASLAVA